MKERTLTFGVKLGISTGILGVIIVVLAALGMHELNSMDAVLNQTVKVNARELELVGALNSAESNMAAGQRGLLMFTFAKDPAHVTAAQTLFLESSTRFQRTLAELRPLLVTDRGRQLAADMEARMTVWLAAYDEVQRLAAAGNPDAAVAVLTEKITPNYIA